ncbi:DUF1217 domain-containing protein [Paracoccus suum]|uniref:DUF1217 domain-containing protein n=1 Tax=Paracoccus suum TaxID=2259340 RepID=A0A344PIH5_9RHOB|nr:DUF1217 domain-containing protein [Paracoccus suum]AXC49180.1 DUF1217 domain-containing protein [Paracoccus suum]
MTGWRLLQRTGTAAVERFASGTQIARTTEKFAAAKDSFGSAEEIVGNYNTMKVALTAFGLEGDINNKAFIRKVLESDLGDAKSLAHRLSDKRYLKLAQAFSLGPGGTRPKPETVVNLVRKAYVEHAFELSVGETDESLRLALNAKRELNLLANRKSTESTKWYTILGSPPLRSVIEGALGVPGSVAKAPIDQQLDTFRAAAGRMFGSSFFDKLNDSANLDKLIETYVARSAASNQQAGYSGPYTTALAILTG